MPIIASFDPGKKNFAFYVEEFNLDVIQKLNSSKHKKNKDDILNILYKTSKTLIIKNKQISSSDYDLEARLNLFYILEKYKKIWKKVDIFIIEQQYFSTFYKNSIQANIEAIKIAETLYTWLLSHYKNAQFFIFGASNKTKVLGCPPKTNKYNRKKWSVQKCKDIFDIRNDDYELIEKYKKKDDISDCVLQCQSFKYLKLII